MDGEDFFKLRKAGKTYISRLFTLDLPAPERVRQVRMVFDGCDEMFFGEIDGAICLRVTGTKRKTQISAIVSQDDKGIRRITFERFQTRSGDWVQASEKDSFTFRKGEFAQLLNFLSQIEFIDLSNEANFQIQDISKKAGPKAIIDADDRGIIDRISSMAGEQKRVLLRSLQQSLTADEINLLLGRRQGLEEYESHLRLNDWNEEKWQNYFEREQWVFGYGLDYRVMRQFSREAVVGVSGTDNRDKPTVDFLMTFTDYTVLVEIKTPSTHIFKARRGGRSGTWEFSTDFMSAVSQVLEQKAEWLASAQHSIHYNKDGTERLIARTRNAKTILVIGSNDEFNRVSSERDRNVMRDTFELFRRDNRSIEIITFDELHERAEFIVRHQSSPVSR